MVSPESAESMSSVWCPRNLASSCQSRQEISCIPVRGKARQRAEQANVHDAGPPRRGPQARSESQRPRDMMISRHQTFVKRPVQKFRRRPARRARHEWTAVPWLYLLAYKHRPHFTAPWHDDTVNPLDEGRSCCWKRRPHGKHRAHVFDRGHAALG